MEYSKMPSDGPFDPDSTVELRPETFALAQELATKKGVDVYAFIRGLVHDELTKREEQS